MKKIFILVVCLMFQLSSLTAFADMGIKGHEEAKVNVSRSNDLLQFKTGGHIMGFKPDRVILANSDSALIVEFVGTGGVEPVAVNYESNVISQKTGAASLGTVEYPNLWEGITVRYEATDGGIAESTYIVKPDADAGKIKLRYNAKTELQSDGSLRYKLPAKQGWMTESRPVAWQEIEGRHVPVEVAFSLKDGVVGFRVGEYDGQHALIIDPTYQWHTFYGGTTVSAKRIALDGSGNIYIAGFSDGSWQGDGNANPLHAHSNGFSDIVVIKLNSSGAYQWHTFYGSSTSVDEDYGIVVDTSGNVYVTGVSFGAWQGDGNANPLHAHSGNGEIFILKLNSSGAYQWHTFYGIDWLFAFGGDDFGVGIALDGSGNVYVTGLSLPWQGDGNTSPLHAHTTWTWPNGSPYDIFVLKLNSSGAYQWHTFYGSDTGEDAGNRVIIDGSNVYITGHSGVTWQGDASASPLHAHSGGNDIVVLKLNSSGAYQWHTFYGSSGNDDGRDITVAGDGNVYVAGLSSATWQGDGSMDPLHAHSGGDEIAVVKLNSSGAYQWHTFYGSAGNDGGWGIALNGNDAVYLTGYSGATWQGDGASDPAHAHSGSNEITLVKLNGSGAYQWHTFYGSSNDDEGWGIAVNGSNLYATGKSSGSWQGDGGADPMHAYTGGDYEVMVLKISDSTAAPNIAVTDSVAPNNDLQIPFGSVTQGSTSNQTVTVTNSGNADLIMDTVGAGNSLSLPFSIAADTCSGQTIAPAGTCTITVRFSPSAAGSFSDDFSIPSSDPDTATITMSVSGTGTAIPVPDISVTDSILPGDDLQMPFGNITQGVSSTSQTVTISNSGSTNLTVSNIQITATDSGQFSLDLSGGASPCGSATPAIAAGSNCTVTVTFSPSSTGSKNATLSITSNDPDEATVNMALSGTGLSSVQNNPPSTPILVFPANGQTGLGTTVEFRWKKVTDPDGDAVTYHLYYCTNSDFTGCAPVDVASANAVKIYYAGGYGMLLIGIAFAGRMSRRKKMLLLIVTAAVLGMMLVSCEGDGGGRSTSASDEVTYTVTDLNGGAYYWKVAADDSRGGTSESGTWSFNTGY